MTRAEKIASGRKLGEARRYLGFKRREVSARVGMSPARLGAIERGDREPAGAELERLAGLYEVGPERFEPERPADLEALAPALCERDRAELRRFAGYLRARRPRARKPLSE